MSLHQAGDPVQQFTDSQGRVWSVSLSLASARRLRDELSIDIQDVLNPEAGLMGRVLYDPFALGRVLWCLSRDQAAERGLTEDEFIAGFTGDVLDLAREAVAQAVIEFFPRDRRAALQSWLEAARAVDEGLVRRAVEEIDAIDVEAVADRLISRKEV